MTTKYITERIREYYCVDKHKEEWLVEKGKVKEGRMLKEACIEIERLQKRVSDQETRINKRWIKSYEDDNKLTDPLNRKIKELKDKVNNHTRLLSDLKYRISFFKEEQK